jgi:hypothetical protein
VKNQFLIGQLTDAVSLESRELSEWSPTGSFTGFAAGRLSIRFDLKENLIGRDQTDWPQRSRVLHNGGS